jgi:hypothetical protein
VDIVEFGSGPASPESRCAATGYDMFVFINTPQKIVMIATYPTLTRTFGLPGMENNRKNIISWNIIASAITNLI